MKIAMVTTQFVEVGGVENMVRSVSSELAEEGHEVSLVTREREQNLDEFADFFEEVYEIEGTESYVDYLRKGRKFFRENKDEFDVFHFQNWSTILPAIGLNLNSVLTTHGTSFGMTWEQEDMLKALGFWPLEQLAFSSTDVLTSVTQHHLKHFYTGESEVIRNGVDLEKFSPTNSSEEFRNKWDIEGTGILIVGRHVRQKGHLELIEAVSEMEDVTLMVPSDGPIREKLEQEADERDVKANFYGKVSEEELVELYQTANIFCLPSWGEGLPLTILEALSCGLLVVVSDLGDNSEVVKDSNAGFTVKPKDADDLRQKLSAVREMDLEEFSENAREYAKENLDWSKIAESYLEVYRQLKD